MGQSASYVPLLTGKQGDFNALGALPEPTRAGLRPILDLPPVAEEKDPTESIELLLKRIGQAFGNGGAAAVDLLGLEGRLAGGMHPVEYLLSRAEWCAASVQVALRTDARHSYIDAIEAFHPRARGVCIRASVTEQISATQLVDDIDRVLNHIKLSRADVHLCWDCGSVAGWSSRPDTVLTEHLRNTDSKEFRMVSVAATTVPAGPEIDKDARPMRVQRREWRSWQRLRATHPSIVFGDYGITGPRPDKPGSGLPAPHLRYTTDSALLIWRGRRADLVSEVDEGLPVTFGDLCRELVERDDFAGASFSPGDHAINEMAQRLRRNKAGALTDGGASNWVEWATSHHIAQVVSSVGR